MQATESKKDIDNIDDRKHVRGSLPRRTRAEQRKLTDLISKCWSYLDMNFHKFDKKTKIAIALEIVKKAIPQKLEHTGDLTIKFEQSDGLVSEIERSYAPSTN